VGYLSGENFSELCKQTNNAAPTMFAMGVGNFATSIGIPVSLGATFITLAISAFILTSLDTGTRLARFLFQEMILPSEGAKDDAVKNSSKVRVFFANRWISTILVVVLAFIILITGESAKIWPVFGSANQLLAAMTLLAVTLYLLRNKCKWIFAMLPMFFMWAVSVYALIELVRKNLHTNMLQAALGIALLVMAFILAGLAFKRVVRAFKEKA